MSAVKSIRNENARPVMLGRYELITRMASGGMAEVYLARLRGPMNFQKIVVLKTIHRHLASQEEFLRMLLDEARLAALIKHPRVVDIYELGQEDETFFIAMEYLEGQPFTRILSRGAAGDRLDPLSSVRLIADAAEGLHAAHELKSMAGRPLGLVHRDVSPGNIMALYDNSAKIVDFGVAKARGRLTISHADDFKGKLGYVAPEQITGAPVDRRTDVFSLGVVLWEALALERLFADETARSLDAPVLYKTPAPPSQVSSAVPVHLDALCLKALAIRPDDRFQTAGELKEALEEVLRRLGYFRESDAIRSYMERVFAMQRARHQGVLRAAAEKSGPIAFDYEAELSGVIRERRARSVDAASDYSAVELDYDAGEDGQDAATRTAMTAPAPRRRLRWVLLPAGLLTAAFVLGAPLVDWESLLSDPRAVINNLVNPGAAPAPAPAPAASLKPESGPPQAAAASGPTGETASAESGSAREAAAGRSDGDSGAESGEPPGSEADRTPATEPGAAAATERQVSPQVSEENVDPVSDQGAASETAPASGSGSRAGKRKSSSPPPPRRSARELHDDGSKQFLLGHHRAARKLFKQALEVDSSHAATHRGLGLVYQAEGQKKKAARHFKKYLQLRPGASDAAAIRKRIAELE